MGSPAPHDEVSIPQGAQCGPLGPPQQQPGRRRPSAPSQAGQGHFHCGFRNHQADQQVWTLPYFHVLSFYTYELLFRGAFGRVYLARKRATGDLYAIKVLKKLDMIRKNMVDHVIAERNILASVQV